MPRHRFAAHDLRRAAGVGADAPRRGSVVAVSLAAGALIVVTVALTGYALWHLSLWLPGYSPLDRLCSALLLLSEVYVALQGVGYYLGVIAAVRVPNVAHQTRLARLNAPGIAIYVATYNEPESVIEATVTAVSLLDYPHKRIYVNCDHQSAEQAEIVAAIARRHGVEYIHRVPNTGFKAGGINAFLNRLGDDLPDAEMFCIFDADSIPQPTFLREIMPYFQDDPRIAFVQAPQSYGNRAVSLVADAAGHQQVTFAQFISEGKQQHQAMFFCGTNVVFRVDALRDIGGLVTTSITEDFATSILLHSRGWRSQYCNAAYVTGLGPTTLRAYWTQQGRWALGNLESCFAEFGKLLVRRGFTPAQRWEYFITGTYYFTGLNALIAMLCPAAYLLLNARPLVISPFIYLIAFLPHFVLANVFFLATMGQRGYRPRILFLAQCLTFVTTPVFVSAALAAIMRRRRPFAVTPKGRDDTTLGWRDLRPHLALGAVLAAAALAGMVRMVVSPQLSLAINIFWCLYHLALLGTLALFNQPERQMMGDERLRAAA